MCIVLYYLQLVNMANLRWILKLKLYLLLSFFIAFVLIGSQLQLATCKHDQLAMDLEIVSTPLIFLNYLEKKNCKSSSNLYLSIAISILVKCALYLYLQVCNCNLLLANMINLRLDLELSPSEYYVEGFIKKGPRFYIKKLLLSELKKKKKNVWSERRIILHVKQRIT
jgi:hypothetical protein